MELLWKRLQFSRIAELHHNNARRSDLVSYQLTFGGTAARILSIESACAGLAERMDRREQSPRCLLPFALAVKESAVEACTGCVSSLAELVGSQAFSRSGSLERLWRDVQALRFHPPKRAITQRFLGRWLLGGDLKLDLDEEPIGEG